MIAQTVQAHARERQCELSLQKMSDQVKDTRFLNTQMCQRLNEREEEIEALKRKNDSRVSKSLLSVKTSSGKVRIYYFFLCY
jgi:ferritin-like metal-binding protein YciE